MADTHVLEAVIDPGQREGREVSFAEDPALIIRALKKGWIKSVELADQLLKEAIEDTAAIRGACDPVELAHLSQGLAKAAWGAVGVRCKAIQTAEGQSGGTTNVQVNVSNGLDLSKLTVEQLKALAGEA